MVENSRCDLDLWHPGAWILTAGLREGVGRCVGEAVRDHATAASSVSLNKVVALGIAPWGLVHNRQQLVNPQVVKALERRPVLPIKMLLTLCEQRKRRASLSCLSQVSAWLCLLFLWLDVMQGSFPAKYFVQNTSRDSSCLDNNYQAFLLVDDGSVGRRGGETGFRAKLEDYISHQRTGIWGEERRAARVGSCIRTDRLFF